MVVISLCILVSEREVITICQDDGEWLGTSSIWISKLLRCGSHLDMSLCMSHL